MASKKTATKKTAAKKTATKKTTAKKTTARKSIARVPAGARAARQSISVRTTNRTNVRAAGDGMPPPGVVLDDALVDLMVLNWVEKPNKTAADYCAYVLTDVVADAKEMLDGREDLELFKEAATPITAREFDWLELLLRRLLACGGKDLMLGAESETITEDILLAIQAVVAARDVVARRGEACNIPLRGLRMKPDPERPDQVVHAGTDVASSARLLINRFNNADHAERIISNLERAVDTLRELRGEKFLLSKEGQDMRAEQAALKRMLYSAMLYLAPWGRDVTAGDPRKTKRYQLDKIFGAKAKKKKPAPTPQPA